MPVKKAAWTVMIYLAGDNNLSAECVFALTEMKRVAPSGQVNVIAQFDPQDDYLPTTVTKSTEKAKRGLWSMTYSMRRVSVIRPVRSISSERVKPQIRSRLLVCKTGEERVERYQI